MFYVSMSKTALDKVVEHAKSRGHEEVVGILTGSVVGQTVIVEDAITGKIESTATRAILPPETMAKIADDIIKQKIQGNIVGWYHSHPGYGIFMSDVDIASQTKLQQFSPYVAALIVDPSTDQVGFFTLNASGTPVSIPQEHVRIFAEGEEPVMPVPPQPTEPIGPSPEVVAPPIIFPRRTSRYLIVTLLVVVIVLGFLGGLVFRDFLSPTKTVIVSEKVDLERIPVTTYSLLTTTYTTTVTLLTSFSVTATIKVTLTSTGAESTDTYTFTHTVTRTISSSFSTATVITTVVTSTFTSTSTSASTTLLTATRPGKAGIISATDPSQHSGLVDAILYSTIVAGILMSRRRSMLLSKLRISI